LRSQRHKAQRHPSSPSATPGQGKAEMENQKSTSIQIVWQKPMMLVTIFLIFIERRAF